LSDIVLIDLQSIAYQCATNINIKELLNILHYL